MTASVDPTPAIRTHDLQKHFAGHPVLHGIDLVVQPGEFLGLVGPNGAGKSTLLRLLIGLIRRTGGSATVFGLDPATETMAVRRRCSYLPGETSVYQQMTGSEFLAFARSFLPGRTLPPRRLLDLFALPLHERVRSYSAGMKQKLAILAALSADVDLYLLDEPDRALDATMRMELRQVLRELHQAGKTVLLSSHHLEELHALATRLEFLRDGRLVPTAEVAAARARLARRFRLQLATDTALPPGATLLHQDPDGALVFEATTTPIAFLRQLPADAVHAAELGTVHLEDLYQELFLADAAGREAPP